MNALNAITTVARQSADLRLAEAHEHAEAFHCALARALRLADDIEDIKRDLRTNSFRSVWAGHDDELADMETQHAAALGDAAAALQKMPQAWAAILQCELPKEAA